MDPHRSHAHGGNPSATNGTTAASGSAPGDPEPKPDASLDARSEAPLDARREAEPDAQSDAPHDAHPDAQSDAPLDGPLDARPIEPRRARPKASPPSQPVAAGSATPETPLLGRAAARRIWWLLAPARALVRPLRRWYRDLPTARKMRLRAWLYLPLDIAERLAGRSDPLVPPRGLRYVGRGDFQRTGEDFLAHFVAIGGLQPSDRVLDVGCGVGRMAVPLTRYLGPQGSYDGFDIVPAAVRWCQSHVTPRFPAFRFQQVDVANRRYHPRGALEASTFRFPYEDGVFDFVLATSVFTHLAPNAASQYLSETSRVLRPGGRCFLTFFLLNDASLTAIEHDVAELRFVHGFGSARTLAPGNPDHAIAYPEDQVRAWMASAGLTIVEPVRYGDWSGRAPAVTHQDILVARRET